MADNLLTTPPKLLSARALSPTSHLSRSPSPRLSRRRKGTAGAAWSKLKTATAMGGILSDVRKKREQTLKQWGEFQEETKSRKEKLLAAKKLKDFLASASGVSAWIDAKSALAKQDNFSDHENIPMKLKEHQSVEAEVGAFAHSVAVVNSQAKELLDANHFASDKIIQQQDEINHKWEDLQQALADKRGKLTAALGDVTSVNTFMTQANGLIASCNEQMLQLNKLQLAEQLAQAISMLKQHKETAAQIDAMSTRITECIQFGNQLIDAETHSKGAIQEKVDDVQEKYKALKTLSAKLTTQFQQCQTWLEYEQFALEIEDWIETQREFLQDLDLGDAIDAVDILMKRHNAFQKMVAAQSSKMQQLATMVKEARGVKHYNLDNFSKLYDTLILSRSELEKESDSRTQLLKESLAHQEFLRDSSEMLDVLRSKQAAAQERPQLHAKNIQTYLGNAQSLQEELRSYKAEVDATSTRAQELVASGNFAAEHIAARSQELEQAWSDIAKATDEKLAHLHQIKDMQVFLKDVGDVSEWLTTLENFVALPVLGNDVQAVMMLLKKQDAAEEEFNGKSAVVASLEERMKAFCEAQHPEKAAAETACLNVLDRFADVKEPLEARRMNLQASLQLQKFLLQVQDQDSWISLKNSVVNNTDYGDSLSAVKILDTRMKGFESELKAKDDAIKEVVEFANLLISQNHYATSVIQERRNSLLESWSDFNTAFENRKMKLSESHNLQRFLADCAEINRFFQDQRTHLSDDHEGEDEDAARTLVERHAAVSSDLKVYSKVIEKLVDDRNTLITANNLGTSKIQAEADAIQKTYKELTTQAALHGTRLAESLSLQQFKRKVDEFTHWVEQNMATATSKDIGENIEDCILLQKSFDDFEQLVSNSSSRLDALVLEAAKLRTAGHSKISTIQDLVYAMENQWKALEEAIAARHKALSSAASVLQFHRDASETMDWIQEKENELDVSDFGTDVASVEALQRKHDVLERDLEALGSKLEKVFGEAGRLIALHPSHAQPITAKQMEMGTRWEKMQTVASERKQHLAVAHKYHKFVENSTELLDWHERVVQELYNLKPPCDVSDAQRQLELHADLKLRIQAQQTVVDAFGDMAELMVEDDHFMSTEIRAVVLEVSEAQEDLIEMWDYFQQVLKEALFSHQLMTELTESEAWISAHESYLKMEELPQTVGDADALIYQFSDFEASLTAREEKIERTQQAAQRLIDEVHQGNLTFEYKKQQSDTFFEAVPEPSLDESMTRRLSHSVLLTNMDEPRGRSLSLSTFRMQGLAPILSRSPSPSPSRRRDTSPYIHGHSLAGGAASPVSSPLASRRRLPQINSDAGSALRPTDTSARPAKSSLPTPKITTTLADDGDPDLECDERQVDMKGDVDATPTRQTQPDIKDISSIELSTPVASSTSIHGPLLTAHETVIETPAASNAGSQPSPTSPTGTMGTPTVPLTHSTPLAQSGATTAAKQVPTAIMASLDESLSEHISSDFEETSLPSTTPLPPPPMFVTPPPLDLPPSTPTPQPPSDSDSDDDDVDDWDI
eukprot:m.95130 g.95130  ORF g.95130 m.95130 type:complete len:1541 (-) comp13042_c3_seq2:1360-5982(-)